MGSSNPTSQSNEKRNRENIGDILPLLLAMDMRRMIIEKSMSSKENSSTPGLEELALKPTKYYKEIIGLSP